MTGQPRLTLRRALLLLAFSYLLMPDRLDAITATWSSMPSNGDWNAPDNWSGLSVPNGAMDIASFGTSDIMNVFLSANTEVNSIVFSADASAYTITNNPTRILTISGAGIVNNSNVTQTLIGAGANNDGSAGIMRFVHNAFLGSNVALIANANSIYQREGALIEFRDSSTAGTGSVTVNGSQNGQGDAGLVRFYDVASAGRATLISNSAPVPATFGGMFEFFGRSTAADASITVNGGGFAGSSLSFGGEVHFFDNASAGSAVITNRGGNAASAIGGITRFNGNSTAATAVITNNGSKVNQGLFGVTAFSDNATAANSLIISNGSIWGYTTGGRTNFGGNSSAGDATLIANAGPGVGALQGGKIDFTGDSTGGTCRLEVFGNGYFDISSHNVPGLTIGSLEGTGTVFLGGNTLTVGTSNRSTEFSGVIVDGNPFGPFGGAGGMTKIGTGTLTLVGHSTYTGQTAVNAGTLLINGSVLTSVLANGGILGGIGTVGGATVGDGATLSPGSARTGILHVSGNLTLRLGATCLLRMSGSEAGSQYDQLAVIGAVALDGASLFLNLSFQPAVGSSFTIIDNDGSDVVAGNFGGLPQGATLDVGGNTFVISYLGGDGNDVVLIAIVPEPQTCVLAWTGLFLLLGTCIARRR